MGNVVEDMATVPGDTVVHPKGGVAYPTITAQLRTVR